MKVDELSKKELISLVEKLLTSNAQLTKTVEVLTNRVAELEEQVRVLQSKKNSGNSSLPPSTDQALPMKNQSLREKSGRKKGGQSGHKGHSLKMSDTPDSIIEHQATFCQVCGQDLSDCSKVLKERRQVVDLPVISPVFTEHRVYSTTCHCGHLAKGSFPARVKAPIQYGAGVESMAAYLSVRQYLPYQRMKECFWDLFGITISQGSLVSAIRGMAVKAKPAYDLIRENILNAKVVGTDETGTKVNGTKAWFWTWQNPKNTLISLDGSRGFKAIESVFADGLPDSVLVSDCWAAQLKTPAVTHQLCIAHLLRELNFFIQLYDSSWAKNLKALLLEAIRYKPKIQDYSSQQPFTQQLHKRLDHLIDFEIESQPTKIKPFHKRLRKNRKHLFPFLYYKEVPADNNASERAIRNVKVKQKISGHFVSWKSAVSFAILRSIIDTSIKNNTNVLYNLRVVAQCYPE